MLLYKHSRESNVTGTWWNWPRYDASARLHLQLTTSIVHVRMAGHTHLPRSSLQCCTIDWENGNSFHLSIVMAKRPAIQFKNMQNAKKMPPPDKFPAILAQAGQKYSDVLNFGVGYTTSKGYHIIVGSKVCHWHPPAGSISRTRIVVHEDGTFYFQVLLCSKEAGTMETDDHFLSVCEIMANLKGEYKICQGIDPCEYETKYFSKIRYDVKKLRRVDAPFERIDSCNCLLFHKLARNTSIIEKGL